MAHVGQLISKKVTRGRFTNYRTGLFTTFVYNPTRINEDKSSNLTIQPIPGSADPLSEWSSAGANVIKFKLNLCGESRLRRDGVQLFNGAEGVQEIPIQEANQTYSIAGEIAFFEQFQFPVALTEGAVVGSPDLIVFSYGGRYQGVLCSLASLGIDVFEFNTKGDPTKAELSFELVRKSMKTRYAHQIWETPSALVPLGQRLQQPAFF
jgi:hypothetical protein